MTGVMVTREREGRREKREDGGSKRTKEGNKEVISIRMDLISEKLSSVRKSIFPSVYVLSTNWKGGNYRKQKI